jgi:diguanylate cyclase (GGDEF)-like protein
LADRFVELLRFALATFLLTAGSALLLQLTGVPVLWPATGLFLSWLSVQGPKTPTGPILVCWLSGCAGLILFGWSLPSAGTMMVLTIVEAFFAFGLLKQMRGKQLDWYDSLDGFITFVICAGVLASAIFAFPASYVGPALAGSRFEVWLAWSIAASLGTLTITPLAALLYSGKLKQEWASKTPQSRDYTILAIILVGATSTVTFAQSHWPIMFLPFFPLVVSAFKAGRLGALLSVLLLSAIATSATEMGLGPIAGVLRESPERFLVLQMYLGTAIMTVLPAAIELRQRELVAVQLRGTMERLQQSERRAHSLAYSDPLTGLANRRAFLEALEKASREPVGICLAILDLNKFKTINDRWGHLVGDQILKAAAERFRNAIGEQAIIARMGGDEFAVLVTDPEVSDPHVLGANIVEALSEPILIGRKEFPMSCACGLTTSLARQQREPSSLLARADVAMYHAKSNPERQVAVFSEAMEEGERRKAVILDSFLTPEGRSGIHLQYQPIFSLATGQVVSFEALARWDHPDLGSIPPSEFIPLAERARVIATLTWQLLEEAIDQAVLWDPQICLSFNTSATHVGLKGVAGEILKRLEKGGLDPRRLKLEITETALLSDSETAAQNCEALQQAGVKIVLDDFGAGFASLSYLRAMRFDEIKLDSSLTLGARRKEGYPLTMGVLDLCRALDVPCTAEHLETEADVERLAAMGCAFGQGFWLHRPLSADAATAMAVNQENLVRMLRRSS